MKLRDIVTCARGAAYNDGMKKLAIVGYGNLGKAVERAAVLGGDFDTIGIFTRRDPRSLTSPFGAKFFEQGDLFDMAKDADIAAICTGSANDVAPIAPLLAARVNTIDSFDTHAKMRRHIAAMDEAARGSGHLSLVGVGWDPGLFSLLRALFCGVLSAGYTQTFWGKGVSQGHGEAIRRIRGVKDAVQYTVPIKSALTLAREGGGEALTDRQKHRRVCYVAVEDGVDKEEIKNAIINMPDYFAPYDVEVHFVSEETIKSKHAAMPHGGEIVRVGEANGERCALDLRLSLASNPDFTAAVLLSYAKAELRLFDEGARGAKTVLDVPISYLFDRERDIVGFV